MRAQQRVLKKTNRELERDRSGLERQERQLVSRVPADTHTHTLHTLTKKTGRHENKANMSIINHTTV